MKLNKQNKTILIVIGAIVVLYFLMKSKTTTAGTAGNVSTTAFGGANPGLFAGESSSTALYNGD